VAIVFGLHSAIDWTWFVPGPAVMALVAAGLAAGRGPVGERLAEAAGAARAAAEPTAAAPPALVGATAAGGAPASNPPPPPPGAARPLGSPPSPAPSRSEQPTSGL